jgi:hypothetical protein
MDASINQAKKERTGNTLHLDSIPKTKQKQKVPQRLREHSLSLQKTHDHTRRKGDINQQRETEATRGAWKQTEES